MPSKTGYVYIMSNRHHTTLYVGMTNNLTRRVAEHKSGKGGKFTSKYKLTHLLYFEEGTNIPGAIAREKELKGWLRKKKETLIDSINPEKKDLSLELWGDSSLCKDSDLGLSGDSSLCKDSDLGLSGDSSLCKDSDLGLSGDSSLCKDSDLGLSGDSSLCKDSDLGLSGDSSLCSE